MLKWTGDTKRRHIPRIEYLAPRKVSWFIFISFGAFVFSLYMHASGHPFP